MFLWYKVEDSHRIYAFEKKCGPEHRVIAWTARTLHYLNFPSSLSTDSMPLAKQNVV